MRSLEADNQRLESKILEHLGKKGPWLETGALFQDHRGEELRAKVFASSVHSACIILQFANVQIAADDFRVTYKM